VPELQRHHLAVNAALGSLLQRRWVSAIPERNKIVIEKTTQKYQKITRKLLFLQSQLAPANQYLSLILTTIIN
jgi:hypothetical protein